MMGARLTRSALCRACETRRAACFGSRSRPSLTWAIKQAAVQCRQPGQQARWHSTSRSGTSKRAIGTRILLSVSVLAGAGIYLSGSDDSKATLNDMTFIPYTITAREDISATSFVFTISPKTPVQFLPYLVPDSSAWSHPLWSVEFKQPEVQIARHYTPLPPRDGEDPRDGSLRFYVRAVGDGEMSNYLGRLRQGQSVWLRGPHWGFDVLKRLGEKRQLVVLAGGTGVVPGLQAAEAVLGSRENTTVSLLWAVRKREELQHAGPPARSSWWAAPGPKELQSELFSPSPVGEQLKQMKARYGDRLRVYVAVDEEGSSFSQKFLADTLATPSGDNSQDERSCQLHCQKLHRTLSEFELQTPGCVCTGEGKNLLLVSGPDGFISHYAGDKVWLGGSHTQGPVGGVTRQIQAQDPRVQSEWLVLKL